LNSFINISEQKEENPVNINVKKVKAWLWHVIWWQMI